MAAQEWPYPLPGFSAANRVLVSRYIATNVNDSDVAYDQRPEPLSVCPAGSEGILFFQLAHFAMRYAWHICIEISQQSPAIYFHLDPDWTPNAYARAVMNDAGRVAHYNSSVTAGLLNNLQILIAAALADDVTLPGVGTVGAPISDRTWLSRVAWGTDIRSHLLEIESSLTPTVRTFDETRMDWLVQATWYAIWFAMQHEWAHIFSGHLDWLIRYGQELSLAENDDRPVLDSLTNHAMEMRADSSGAASLLRDTSPTLAHQAGFGVAILLSLFAQKTLLESSDTIDHPHTTMRAFTLMHLGVNLGESWARVISEDALAKWREGFVEGTMALERAEISSGLLGAVLAEHLRSSSDDVVDTVVQKIRARHKAVYDRCLKVDNEVRRIEWWHD